MEQQTTESWTPPYVVRAERSDGAATMGIMQDQPFEEGNVHGFEDLKARLEAARLRPELRVTWRAGDSEVWHSADTDPSR